MGVKPGVRTSELWLTVATALLAVAAAAVDWLPPRYAAVASAVAVGCYNVARGLAKHGAPSPPRPASPAPPPLSD